MNNEVKGLQFLVNQENCCLIRRVNIRILRESMKISCIWDRKSPRGKRLAPPVTIPYRRPWGERDVIGRNEWSGLLDGFAKQFWFAFLHSFVFCVNLEQILWKRIPDSTARLLIRFNLPHSVPLYWGPIPTMFVCTALTRLAVLSRDPETLARQEALAKKEKMDKDDQERMLEFIERQVRLASWSGRSRKLRLAEEYNSAYWI